MSSRRPLRVLLLLPAVLIACGGGTTASEPDLALGKQMYNQYCLACHQADGSGVPGLYPPVRETEWVSGDKERLIRIILEGMSGEIEVHGEIYKGEMAAHDFLTDEEIAALLSYMRQSFGNQASAVQPGEVAAVRNRLR